MRVAFVVSLMVLCMFRMFVSIVFVPGVLVAVFAMFVSVWIHVFSVRAAFLVSFMALCVFRMVVSCVFRVLRSVCVVPVSVLGMVALVIEVMCCSFGAAQKCTYFQNACRLAGLGG